MLVVAVGPHVAEGVLGAFDGDDSREAIKVERLPFGVLDAAA